MIEQPEMGQLKLDRRTVLANVITLFSSSSISHLLLSISLLLIARQLGPVQYGQYSSSLALALFCSIFFNLGLRLWILREGGRQPAQIGLLVGSVLALVGAIGAVWVLLMYVLAPMIQSSSFPTDLVRLSALFILFNTLFETTISAFKAILRNQINFILTSLTAVGIFLLTIYLIAIGAARASLFLQARIIVSALGLVAAIILAHRLLRLSASLPTGRRALVQSPPYAASEFLVWLFMRLDILIVAIMLNEYAVGIYSPAVGIVNALFILPASVHVVFIPVLSNLFLSNPRQAWTTAWRMILLLLVMGLALFALLYALSPLIPLILGPAYGQSVSILKLLSIILVFHSINYGVAAILVATGQQSRRSIVQAVVVAISGLLNLAIIQRMGINGVALVYVVAEIMLLLGYIWIVYRYRRRTRAGERQPGKQLLG
jgi:O-antigen/teichoic acid export membrane protein